MSRTTILNFQIDLPAVTKTTGKKTASNVLSSHVATASKEERDYQQLVREKLKAAADWDFRDSKQLKITS